jgi:hypothetical protein
MNSGRGFISLGDVVKNRSVCYFFFYSFKTGIAVKRVHHISPGGFIKSQRPFVMFFGFSVHNVATITRRSRFQSADIASALLSIWLSLMDRIDELKGESIYGNFLAK